jgi:HK97 family phage major capsid protein
MSALLKTLNETRGAKLKEAQSITSKLESEKRGFTDDERTSIRGINDEIEKIDVDIQQEVRTIANLSKQPQNLSVGEQRTVASFDLGKALRALTSGKPTDGVEAEMLQQGEREARAAGIFSETGICLPSMLCRKESRDMTALGGTLGSEGGMTVQTEKRGLLDDFFNASLMASLGATVLQGLSGNIDMPRLLAGTNPVKKTENASADEVSPTTAMVTMTPKRLPAFIDLSQQLLLQSSAAIEAIIRNHLSNQLLAIQEAGFFHGGGTNEAQGLAGTAGIGSVALGTNGLAPTYAALIALETAIDTVNALGGNLKYASNGQIRGKLKSTLKNPAGTGSDFVLNDLSPNTINGYGAGWSNAISRTLTKGSSSGVASAIFFGNFTDYVIGYWGGLQLDVLRDSTNAKLGLVTLIANTYYDGVCVRPKSFAATLDALGA